jgi:translocation and assembly module TamA
MLPFVFRRLPAMVFFLALVEAAGANQSVFLEIQGGSDALVDNVRAHLALEELPCDIAELRLRSRLRSADESISRALRALGYYRGDWHLIRERTEDCWRIRVQLNPGERVTLASVSLDIEGEAAGDPAFNRLLDNLPLREGMPLNHDNYRQARVSIEELGRNRGYFDGRFTERRLQVDTRANTATVRLRYQSGPRYRFGAIDFGDNPLDSSFLRRFSPFAPGDPYSTDALIALQHALNDSQYFKRASVDQGNPDAGSHRVPIHVELSPRSKFLTTLGVGASTDTGPRLSTGFANRRVNRRGHTYKLSGQWSPVLSNASFQYRIPGEDPLHERIILGAGVQREETDTAESTSYQLEASRTTRQGEDWLQTLSLSFIQENYRIADESRTATLLVPGINWSRSEANDSRYPTRGWRINASLRGAVEGLISDTSFSQAALDGKLILPLIGGRLITRAAGGATAVSDFSALPASLRFFAGGDNSVRGFAYESLGPENAAGEVLGGKYLLTGSVEYDYPVWEKYSAAIFFDAGNAFDSDQFNLHRSAGFGVRWRSPIGPIRVDFAFPLADGGFRLHLSMGPDL